MVTCCHHHCRSLSEWLTTDLRSRSSRLFLLTHREMQKIKRITRLLHSMFLTILCLQQQQQRRKAMLGRRKAQEIYATLTLVKHQ